MSFVMAGTTTTYGTIPTSSSSSSGRATNFEYLSRANEQLRAGLAERRSWKQMFQIHSINLPRSVADAIGRIKANGAYFRMNYVMMVLMILFLSLLWHPISIIVFVAVMAVWLLLYFLRDQPLLIFNRLIDDRLVMAVLSLLTLVLLLLTDATLNIVVALLVGLAVVAIHAAIRRTDDLYYDEEAAVRSGLLA